MVDFAELEEGLDCPDDYRLACTTFPSNVGKKLLRWFVWYTDNNRGILTYIANVVKAGTLSMGQRRGSKSI